MNYRLNRCLKCGSDIEYKEIVQFTYVNKINSVGKIAKVRNRREVDGVQKRIIQCTKCGFTIEAEGENEEYNIKTFIENDILFYDKARVGEKMKKDEFEKLLNDARECYEKAKNLETKAFDEITDALHGEDLMTITTTVNKAENLEQALWDYIHGCGTGNVDMLWHDITHRAMEV